MAFSVKMMVRGRIPDSLYTKNWHIACLLSFRDNPLPSTANERTIGTYRVLRKLGEGGMGSVYEAEHLSIARRVAIKVLHPSYSSDPEALARFYNEARAANLIDHPSIVQVLDYGQQEDGSFYFIMELLKGETLRSRIERSKKGVGIGLDEALRIGRQLASTLAAAHGCGIVHRDLKPENIMLIPDPEATDGQRVKILDFGIAKLAHWVDAAEVRTRTNMIIGTPAYMSPEQCRGAALVDERADVYSLGVVLFELIAGQRPFSGSSAGEYMGQHLFCDPPSIDALVPNIPAECTELMVSLLCKNRESRPRMSQVLAQLEILCKARRGALASVSHSIELVIEDEPKTGVANSDAPDQLLSSAASSCVPARLVQAESIHRVWPYPVVLLTLVCTVLAGFWWGRMINRDSVQSLRQPSANVGVSLPDFGVQQSLGLFVKPVGQPLPLLVADSPVARPPKKRMERTAVTNGQTSGRQTIRSTSSASHGTRNQAVAAPLSPRIRPSNEVEPHEILED